MSVAGEKGDPGASAYEIAVQNGFTGTEAEWLASLKGEQGEDGIKGNTGEKGNPGDSAYQIAVNNGFIGTESEWLSCMIIQTNTRTRQLQLYRNSEDFYPSPLTRG